MSDHLLAAHDAADSSNDAPAEAERHVQPLRPAATPRTTLFSRRTQTLLGIQIAGTGSYVPSQVVTNEDLARQHGCDPEWIVKRSGVRERRHAAADQATSDLAAEAGYRAIRDAGIDPSEIDLLVVGTFTPDHFAPSTACLVQDKLQLDVPAFDVSAACSGFMYALATAGQFVATGNAQNALVIGADTNSRIVDPSDQKTYPLFGDGAGAVLLRAGEPHQGLMCYQMGADGAGGGLLETPSGGSRCPLTAAGIDAGEQYLKMDGRSVFKWAVRSVADTIDLVLANSGLTADDISLLVLHQANIRIIDAAMKHLGIPSEKAFTNLDKYGNTSGASVPLALDEAVRSGRIEPGDVVLMSGFGAGLTWGTGLFRW